MYKFLGCALVLSATNLLACGGALESSSADEPNEPAPAGLTVQALVNCTTSSGGCDGKDPTTTVCGSDAVTISTAAYKVSGVLRGTFELRKSAKCSTYWIRWVPKSIVNETLVRMSLEKDTADGGYATVKKELTGLTNIRKSGWTTMGYQARPVCSSVEVYRNTTQLLNDSVCNEYF